MLDTVIRGGKIVDGSGAPAFSGDVGVRDGMIVEVGRITTPARRTVDADGLLVTPGFIDVHTHYDGQATWDAMLDPSFSTGVTTGLMGNCGVGFAPVHDEHRERLIELMEGVEEIPGTALHEGLKWEWNSFTEYMDVLARTPRTFDIGCIVPHGPLRLYTMGDKVGTDKCANGDDLALMQRELHDAMAAGAFGISTSRTPVHRTLRGDMTPDYEVDEPELRTLAQTVADFRGFFECAPQGLGGELGDALQREMAMFGNIVDDIGVNLHVLMLQTEASPDYWREQMHWAETVNRRGKSGAYMQVGGRAVGLLLSFAGMNPFMDRPTFKQVIKLPRDQWAHEFAKPEVRDRILTEPSADTPFSAMISNLWHCAHDLGADYDYEPGTDRNLVRQAEREGASVQRLVYDGMLASPDSPRTWMTLTNYAGGNLDATAEMLDSPASVLGSSDAGAHVNTVCDGSIFTFMLTHWGRDRKRGPKLPLERIVLKMTSNSAKSVGLADRGTIAVGKRADINVIDFDALTLSPPKMVYDLPAGSPRILQHPSGFRMTMVAGVPTREHDNDTGERPGGLLRYNAASARN